MSLRRIQRPHGVYPLCVHFGFVSIQIRETALQTEDGETLAGPADWCFNGVEGEAAVVPEFGEMVPAARGAFGSSGSLSSQKRKMAKGNRRDGIRCHPK